MLSQLSRLIGLEGRPQANWICRGLINSGKPFFFFDSQTYRSTSAPHFTPPLLKPTSLPIPFHNYNNLRERETGRTEQMLFSSPCSQQAMLGSVLQYLCVAVSGYLCMCMCVKERERQTDTELAIY